MTSLLLFAALPLIKSPEAPFVAKSVELERPPLVLNSDAAVSGTKRVSWQNNTHNLTIDAFGRRVAAMEMRVRPNAKWEEFRHFTQTALDEGSILRACKYGYGGIGNVRSEDNRPKPGVFTQKISKNGEAVRIEMQWKMEKDIPLEEQILTIDVPIDVAYGAKGVFTDAKGRRKEGVYRSSDNWDTRKDKTKWLWECDGWMEYPREFTFNADRPEFGYTLRFPEGGLSLIRMWRSINGGAIYFTFDKASLGKPFVMEIVPGASAIPPKGGCVIDGINFTQNNDFEIVRWGKRNLLANPSFEADSRYWTVRSGGIFSDDNIVPGGRTGRFACNGPVYSFCVPMLANRDYVISMYVRDPEGEGRQINVRQFGSTRSGIYLGSKGPKKGATEWERVSFPVKAEDRVGSFYIHNDKHILLDDVQLELGTEPTEFECPPLAVVLKTDSPDRYRGDEKQVFDPRLVIRGETGIKGIAKVEVKDFFGRVTYKGRGAFEIADGGEAMVAIPESAVAAKGVNVIKVTLESEGMRPITDFLRIARYRYATGDEPNVRYVHNREGYGWLSDDPKRRDDRLWKMNRSFGMTDFSKIGEALANHTRYFKDPVERESIARWYQDHGGRCKMEIFRQKVKRVPFENCSTPVYHYMNEEGITWDNMPDVTDGYTEEQLAMVERAVYRMVKENPWVTDWIGTSELGIMWNMTKKSDYHNYTKFLMAAHRGLKRANPNARFIPHGTCNAGKQGRAEHHAIMEETKKIDPNWKWDGFQVHPYRAHPEFPSLESDLSLLFKDLDNHGMPDATVFADEGAYFYSLLVKEWGNISPWSGTWETDCMINTLHPTYDLGWGEKVAAAMLMRYYLQCYKFIPRLDYVCVWGAYPLDMYNPYANFVGTAAETEFLGYAKYLGDVRFGSGARAYFFDDGKGGCVAAVWKFTVPLDYGTEKAAEMYVKLPQDCEIYDMMGNPCAAADADGHAGRVILPLSNFPLFLKAKRGDYEALKSAVADCTTSDDGKARKLYDPPAARIAKCGEKPDWSKIGAIELPHREMTLIAERAGAKWGGKDEFSASYKVAWNDTGLFLRVEVKDDIFCLDHTNRACTRWGPSQWYSHEGVQVFFDTLGDARENFKLEMTDNDDNDTSYELLPSNEVAAIVFRRDAPDIQQTGGVGDPLKANVVVPEVKCDFRWDKVAKTRVYDVFFPARQLMPMQIAVGEKMGMSFLVFDRDAPGNDEGKQTLSDIPVKLGTPFRHPFLYSNFVFGECPVEPPSVE